MNTSEPAGFCAGCIILLTRKVTGFLMVSAGQGSNVPVIYVKSLISV